MIVSICNRISRNAILDFQSIIKWAYLRGSWTFFTEICLQFSSGDVLFLSRIFCPPGGVCNAGNLDHNDWTADLLFDPGLFVQSKHFEIVINLSRRIFFFKNWKFTEKMNYRWKAQICNLSFQLLIGKKLGRFEVGITFRYREYIRPGVIGNVTNVISWTSRWIYIPSFPPSDK